MAVAGARVHRGHACGGRLSLVRLVAQPGGSDRDVLVEAFRDDEAGGARVRSDHFSKATSELPAYLQRTPDIVNFTVPGDRWSELGEMAVQ